MRVLLDACVLFPTVLRETLVGAAEAGGFTPLWSPRILEEWARATRRLPDGAETIARAEIALLCDRWPSAQLVPDPGLIETLSLPDPGDRHVLAAAITGAADALLTANIRDFPTRTLARHRILRRDPDGLLVELAHAGVAVATVASKVQARAEAASQRPQPLRPLLKRAGLPRLAKMLCQTG